MRNTDRNAVVALAVAGALWGLTVPLSKLVLPWLGPGWLTVARFAIAVPLLALASRRDLRRALTPAIIAAGAIGFGIVVVVQNVGIAHTSVSHASVIVGVVPVLVALIAAGRGDGRPGALGWAGYGVALGGIVLVAGSGGRGATSAGDLIVLASAALSAAFIATQPRLLRGQDPAAVTAVQFMAGAIVSTPLALTGGVPSAPAGAVPVLALLALGAVGTLVPFWLFAWGQARVPARLAGAFVNLEPVVGAAIGWLAFGNVATPGQLAGAAAVLAGIGLSTLPSTAARAGRQRAGAWRARARVAAPRLARLAFGQAFVR
ncbi:MAG TPA: DMT family transporter [Solirubrobacteraceae bacterium]|jgi:drug/metabolite transporter (DMT)-like permease|nr:DMT family transporter [Solirubrobacteraceae bacterium]